MTVKDIYDFIDGFAPFETQENWDNSGLITGDWSSDVKTAIVSLDVTDDEVGLAIKENAQLIISHHPLIFHAAKNVLKGNALYSAVSHGINVISAHTNLDKAPGGVNDCLCDLMGLQYFKIPAPAANGFLNVCTDSRALPPKDFAEYTSERLSASVRFSEGSKKVSKIAVCSGAGADFFDDAVSLGCDGYLTGDAAYHNFLEAAAKGISLFAAGHFETENIIASKLAERLGGRFPDIKFIVSDRKPPVITVN